MTLGIFQDAFPRPEISGNPSHHYANKCLQYDTRGSRFQYLDKNVGLVLKNSGALISLLFHVPKYFLRYLVPIRKKMMPNSLNSRRELRIVLLEQEGFQKRFLKYQ